MKHAVFGRTTAISLIATALLATTTSAALADEWHNVPHATYWRNGQTVTPDMITDQQTVVLSHCLKVAYETIPGRARTILGKAFTTGLAGALGNGSGTEGEAAMLGQHLVRNALPAVTFGGFLANIFFGGFQGNAEVNSLFREQTDACLARSAGGIYTMAPSEARDILNSGLPKVVGVSKFWGMPRPAGAPFVPMTPPTPTVPYSAQPVSPAVIEPQG